MLLGEYITVLELVTTQKDGRRTAKILAHLHMRRRLKLVRDAYLQIAQSLAQAGVSAYREWLNDAAKGLTEMIDTLVGWKRPGIVALIPLAIGIYSNLFEDTTLATVILLVVFGYSLFFGLLALPFVWEGFHVKRRLFTQPMGDPPRPRNVYEVENTLFNLIRREKPVELDLDQWVLIAPVVLCVELPIIGVFIVSQDWSFDHWPWFTPLIALALVLTFLLNRRWARIADRPR
jgi:hypothetical protein